MTALANLQPTPRAGPRGTSGVPWIVAILAMSGAGVVSLVWLVSSLHAARGTELLDIAGALILAGALALAAVGVRTLAEGPARAAVRARVLSRLVESGRFFALRPSEAAIRQYLAEAITELTGKGAAVSGPDDRLGHRSGAAVHWRGAIEAELEALAQRAVGGRPVEAPGTEAAGPSTVSLGVFRARTDSLNSLVFGAAVWIRPAGSGTFVRETDQYIAMLIELASAAIVQRRKDAVLSSGVTPARFGERGARRLGLV